VVHLYAEKPYTAVDQLGQRCELKSAGGDV
jgi:hypothetical protein